MREAEIDREIRRPYACPAGRKLALFMAAGDIVFVPPVWKQELCHLGGNWENLTKVSDEIAYPLGDIF